MKLLGTLLILLGCGWVSGQEIRRRRRETACLQELSAALLAMASAIRWKKEELPKVIARQEERPLCGTYFAAVSERLAQGEPLQEAWRQAFSAVIPTEAGEWLCRMELGGDEAHLLGNLQLTAERLQALCRERTQKQQQEERLRLTVLFSGAGMMIILLW